jgi:hypothetical protein
MLTPEQATILRTMIHPALGGTLHHVDLDDLVIASLVAANYAYVSDDYDERNFGVTLNEWLQITTDGREALAAYDASHITVPRAALDRLYRFCTELTCPDPISAELDELEAYLAPK